MSYAGKVTTLVEADTKKFGTDIDKVEKRFKKFGKNTKKAANDSAGGITKAFKGAGQGIAAINGPLGGISGRFNAIVGIVTSANLAVVGFGAAIAGAAALIGASASEYAKVETQQLKTQAILKATGYAAGFSASQLDSQARAIALATLASTEGVRDAQNSLLTFKSVQGSVFSETIRLSQDLADSGFGSLKTNAIGLGKALQDPLTGLTLLTKQGSLTKAEQKAIGDEFKRTGDLAAAQATILEAIRKQVGGAGESAAGGLSGAADTFGQKWGEMLEALADRSGSGRVATDLISRMAIGLDILNKKIAPLAGDAKVNQLFSDRLEIQMKIADLEGKGDRRSLASANRLRGDRDALTKQLQEAGAEQEAQRTKELAQYEKGKAERERIDKEAKAAREKEKADETAKEVAKQLIKDQRIVDLTKVRFQRIHEEALAAQGREEELATYKYDQETIKLEADLEKIRASTALKEEAKAEIEEDYKIRARERASAHGLELLEIEKKARETKTAEEIKANANLARISHKLVSDKITGENKFLATAMQVGALLLDTKKREALKTAVMDGATAIQKAWASAAFPYNIPAVGMATAQSAANIATIAGIAHGGLDFVPEANKTYMLDKGERVLSPSQNKDFTGFMKNGGGGAPIINIHNYSGQSVEQSQNGDQVEIIIGKVKASIVEDVNRGTGVSIAFQQRYNLTRGGSI